MSTKTFTGAFGAPALADVGEMLTRLNGPAVDAAVLEDASQMLLALQAAYAKVYDDAMRYRWLRDHLSYPTIMEHSLAAERARHISRDMEGWAWDAAIDAAQGAT